MSCVCMCHYMGVKKPIKIAAITERFNPTVCRFKPLAPATDNLNSVQNSNIKQTNILLLHLICNNLNRSKKSIQ